MKSKLKTLSFFALCVLIEILPTVISWILSIIQFWQCILRSRRFVICPSEVTIENLQSSWSKYFAHLTKFPKYLYGVDSQTFSYLNTLKKVILEYQDLIFSYKFLWGFVRSILLLGKKMANMSSNNVVVVILTWGAFFRNSSSLRSFLMTPRLSCNWWFSKNYPFFLCFFRSFFDFLPSPFAGFSFKGSVVILLKPSLLFLLDAMGNTSSSNSCPTVCATP